jgi:hypothetical protein
LQSLNIVNLPPVVSPQLTKLVVKDKYRQFTNAVLTEILGFAAAVPTIQELNFLGSPVSNSELADIMEQCEHLVIFRVSSRGETQMDVYTKLTSPAPTTLSLPFICSTARCRNNGNTPPDWHQVWRIFNRQ